jgi:hypothetical protein
MKIPPPHAQVQNANLEAWKEKMQMSNSNLILV